MSVLYDLEPTGREIPPPTRRLQRPRRRRRDPELARDARPRPGRAADAAAADARKLPSTLPYLDVAPSILGIPGAETISRASAHARAARSAAVATARSSPGRATGPRASRSAAGSPPTAASASARCRSTTSRDQELARRQGQRRGRRALRRRGAGLADRQRRAPGRAAARPDPGLGPDRGADGHLRQPRLGDDRADPDRRARSGAAGLRAPRRWARPRPATTRCRPSCCRT